MLRGRTSIHQALLGGALPGPLKRAFRETDAVLMRGRRPLTIFGAVCCSGLALIALRSHDWLAAAFWGTVGLFLIYRIVRPAPDVPPDLWNPQFQVRQALKIAVGLGVLALYGWGSAEARTGGISTAGEYVMGAFVLGCILFLGLAAFYSTERGREYLRRMRARRGG